ncbi:MAG: hypothetical protein JWP69_2196 [Flaviaesturariibacter sp.]|nr:hypothetical protein [Flaviaesturariibacter sp.]
MADQAVAKEVSAIKEAPRASFFVRGKGFGVWGLGLGGLGVWETSDEEGGHVLGTEAGVGAEFFYGDEAAATFFRFFTHCGQQLAGGAFAATGNVHHIFGIDHNSVGDGAHAGPFWLKMPYKAALPNRNGQGEKRKS